MDIFTAHSGFPGSITPHLDGAPHSQTHESRFFSTISPTINNIESTQVEASSEELNMVNSTVL